MKLATLLLVAAFPLAAQSSDWTRADTYREVAMCTVSALDWGQTLDIVDRPTLLVALPGGGTETVSRAELNPILGRHPTRGRVNIYFALSIGLHILIARLLPPRWRHAFQYISLGEEGGVVSRNYTLGFQARF